MTRLFINDPETKTDDLGYLLETVSRVAMPYFLIISGIGLVVYASSDRVRENIRSNIINIGSGLTGAALIAIDSRGQKKEIRIDEGVSRDLSGRGRADEKQQN